MASTDIRYTWTTRPDGTYAIRVTRTRRWSWTGGLLGYRWRSETRDYASTEPPRSPRRAWRQACRQLQS
jgi:hypothetical protein